MHFLGSYDGPYKNTVYLMSSTDLGASPTHNYDLFSLSLPEKEDHAKIRLNDPRFQNVPYNESAVDEGAKTVLDTLHKIFGPGR